MTAVIALGSNLGDRRAHLQWAIERLAAVLTDLRVSRFHETEPVGVPDPQPPYLNAVAVGETTMEPDGLFAILTDIERERGRERHSPRAARTLDCDLILHGDRVIATPALRVPHPRFRERAFVLEPLVEIAPEVRDPETGLTAADLLKRLSPGASSEAPGLE